MVTYLCRDTQSRMGMGNRQTGIHTHTHTHTLEKMVLTAHLRVSLGLGAVLGAESYFSSPVSMVQTKSLQVPTVGWGVLCCLSMGQTCLPLESRGVPSCETRTFHNVSFHFLVALTCRSCVVQDSKKTKPNS